MRKEEVRAQIRSKKRALTEKEQKDRGMQAFLCLTEAKEYKEASYLFTYVSYNQEIDTWQVIRQAFADGKQVAVPKVEGVEIVFYQITSLEELQEGYQGIMEPNTTIRIEPNKRESIFMLLPGLAFSKTGERIGYGGGFYDRYLERYKEASIKKCGFAYDFQVFPELAIEEFDQKVDFVVTEKGMYDCKAVQERM